MIEGLSLNRAWFEIGRRDGLRLGITMTLGVIAGCAALGAFAWWLQ